MFVSAVGQKNEWGKRPKEKNGLVKAKNSHKEIGHVIDNKFLTDSISSDANGQEVEDVLMARLKSRFELPTDQLLKLNGLRNLPLPSR